MNKILLVFAISAVIDFSIAAANESTEPISPLPEKMKLLDANKIKLGQMLFEDKRLSRNRTVSCSTCHSLQRGGADSLVKSIGINGAIGDINAPSIFNSGFNFRQFWNGRAQTLEDQIDGPIENPKEMGSEWVHVLIAIKDDPIYISLFTKIYKEPATKTSIKDAIATFERSLITPNSRFDKYLRGEDVLSATEKSGYQKFKSFGCISCHQGINVGGNMFQTMGVMKNYFKDRGTAITDADLGRYMTTKNEADKFVFRVPSLRNVELTAPYFHDGTAATLEQAVSVMAKYQLGQKISKEDTTAIAEFLKTLTGVQPRLPASHPEGK